jgi:Skp family chaperone for outer membrane proteins
VKKCLMLAACFGAFAALGATTAQAQSNVAIIDLSYIFKEHIGFKAQTERMKADVQAAEENLKNERDSLASLLKEFQEAPPVKKGSQEYKQMEEDLAKRQADLQIAVQLRKKEFMEREAKIYYSVFKEIMQEVKYHCEQNRVIMVLRFNGDPVDPTDPQSILKELNKSVVYYQEQIDITPIILGNLNKRISNKPATRPGVPAPR